MFEIRAVFIAYGDVMTEETVKKRETAEKTILLQKHTDAIYAIGRLTMVLDDKSEIKKDLTEIQKKLCQEICKL